jgi:hypothetical protein
MNQPIATKYDLDKLEKQLRIDISANQDFLTSQALAYATVILSHLIQIENPNTLPNECRRRAAMELREASDHISR